MSFLNPSPSGDGINENNHVDLMMEIKNYAIKGIVGVKRIREPASLRAS
jgi:hypothetical protein